jgi:hypothetical protein
MPLTGGFSQIFQTPRFDPGRWSAYTTHPGISSRLSTLQALPNIDTPGWDITNRKSTDLMRTIEQHGSMRVFIAPGVIMEVHMNVTRFSGKSSYLRKEFAGEHYFPFFGG